MAATSASCSVRSAAVRPAASLSKAPGEDADEAQQREHRGARAMTGGGEHRQALHGDERERRAERRSDQDDRIVGEAG